MAAGYDIYKTVLHVGCPDAGAASLAIWLADLPVAGNGWPARAAQVARDIERQRDNGGEIDWSSFDWPFADLKIPKTDIAVRQWLIGHIGGDAVQSLERVGG